MVGVNRNFQTDVRVRSTNPIEQVLLPDCIVGFVVVGPVDTEVTPIERRNAP